MDLLTAEKATRNGATAGFFSAAVTLVVVIFASAGGAVGGLEGLADPLSLLDAALVAGLAFGVRKRSRAAAIALFVYFLVSKIYLSVELGRPAGVAVALIFLYYFGQAIAGSFAYHRIRRERDASYRAAGNWMYFVWPPVALIALVLLLYFLSSALRLTPPLGVIPGDELRTRELDLLITEGLLEPGENVVLFYSTGLLSILEGGSILTGERIVSYLEADGKLLARAATYAEIADIAVERKGDFLNDTIITVVMQDGNAFRLLASTEKGGDLRLIEEARQRWHAADK